MIKHVYFLHPDTIFRDTKTGPGIYCGVYDCTEEQVNFGHCAHPGDQIQIDQGKKARSEATDLEFNKAKKISEIVAAHDLAISAGCPYDGKVFKCDGDSRNMLREAIDINEFPVTWFSILREPYVLDLTKANNLLSAMREFVKPIKIERYSKEALVFSKTTVEDVKSV